MPIGRKEEDEIANDKLRITEFLESKKDNEKPLYSAKELAETNEIKFDVFTVNEIEEYLNKCFLSNPSLLRGVDYKGVRYYKYIY